MDTCQNCKPWQFYGHFSEFMCIVSIQLQTLAVLWTLFGHFVSPWGFCMIQNCKRWQFYGHFSELWPKTANGGSFMDTFRSCGNPVTKLQTLAVLWTLFGVFKKCPYNCQRWQFYGHIIQIFFWSVKTANLGSSMVTFRTLVLWCVSKGHLVVILGGMELDFGSSVNNFRFLVDGFSRFS